MDWFETPEPVSWEKPATTACAITSDDPIVTNGSSIVTALR